MTAFIKWRRFNFLVVVVVVSSMNVTKLLRQLLHEFFNVATVADKGAHELYVVVVSSIPHVGVTFLYVDARPLAHFKSSDQILPMPSNACGNVQKEILNTRSYPRARTVSSGATGETADQIISLCDRSLFVYLSSR